MRYTREQACLAWLAQGMLGSRRLKKLLDEYGSAEAAYDAFQRDHGASLQNRISDYSLSLLRASASREKLHDMLVTMRKWNMGLVSMADDMYPESLRNIPEPPYMLFYQGDLRAAEGRCITVIGSRSATVAGIAATKSLCRDLSKQGVCIVSGLAVGIDAAAHEGCLDGGSLTIADENKNGKLTAKGGDYGAGIGGGWRGSGSDITISGGEVNATGGVNGAGIGGGCYGYGNNITVSGDAKLKVQGGVEDNIDGAGAGIGNGGSSDERAIPVTGAEVEPDTSGLTTNGSIEYYAPGADMEKDKPEKTTVGTLSPQEKPIEPIEPAVPEQPEAERGMDAPLYRVTDKDGRDIVYTAERKDGVLTVNVDEDFAILTGRLSGIRTLNVQGVEKIIFVTKGAASAFLLSDLLEKGESGDTYKLTHDGKAVTFTLGEKMTDVSAILTKP